MLELIRDAALATYPKEAVWLVTESGVQQVENIHPDPHNFFQVSLEDTRAAQKEGLKAVIHSHCDGSPTPSAADMYTQQLMDVPWGIINVTKQNTSEIIWFGSEDIPELVGRPFIHGISDCYSLVRDYFRQKGIYTDDVPRDWLWWEKGDDLITESFQKLGFVEVPLSELQEGDAFISQVRSAVPHHCGIYLGGDLILHHPGASSPIDKSKLSVIEPIHRYLPYITKIVRRV